MRCRLALIGLLGGCNLVFGVDGIEGAGARVCAPGQPFPASTIVNTPGSYNVEAVRFDRQKTRAYLALFPDGGNKNQTDIYIADYIADTDRFSAVSPLGGVSTADYDSYPSPTPDGQHVLMGTEQFGGVKLVVASAVDDSFLEPKFTTLDLVPGATDANEPYVLGDAMTLLFGSGDSTDWDVYRASGAPPTYGGPGTAVRIRGVNRPTSNEFAPVETDDELEIFFSSNRERPAGDPGLPIDIFTATRNAADQDFQTPTKVATLSPGYTNFPLWISADACELYFIDKTMTGDQATLRVSRR